MKKSTLALAVAAALVGFGSAAYADTTLYGSARVSVDYQDEESTYLYNGGQIVPGGRLTIGNDSWDVFNNVSRIGVRGEEDLGGGLSAIYNFEFPVDISEGDNFAGSRGRPKWAGLKGTSWGSFTLGTQWTPYYNVIGIGDIFNSSKAFDRDAYLGDAFGLRMDNSLIYSTPNWSGFSAQAMLVVNGSCGTVDSTDACFTNVNNRLPGNLSDGVDMWNVAMSYKNGPFFAGATYMATNNGNDVATFLDENGDDRDQWGLAVGYNAGPFAVSLSYEDGDLNALYAGDTSNIFLTGQYTFGNNVIRAAYGFASPDDEVVGALGGTRRVQEDINNFVLGYQYSFSKRTRVFAEYLGRYVDDTRVTGLNTSVYGDSQTVSIGTRIDF